MIPCFKFGENVILAGGSGKYGLTGKIKNTVVSYNIETHKSTELPPMKNYRSECCAIVDGNSLVVMGGKGREYNSIQSSVSENFHMD